MLNSCALYCSPSGPSGLYKILLGVVSFSLSFAVTKQLLFHVLVYIMSDNETDSSRTIRGIGNIQPPSGHSSSSPSEAHPELVQQVFGLFKTYLNQKIGEKGRQTEAKSKIEKVSVQLKFKGNRKQFQLNAQLDNILDKIQTENDPSSNEGIGILVAEGKELIKKGQKLIKIADSTKDGWQVVNEYESDELASGSEDEKKLKKVKDAVTRKRKSKAEQGRNDFKRYRNSPDTNQLFVVRPLFCFILCDLWMVSA